MKTLYSKWHTTRHRGWKFSHSILPFPLSFPLYIFLFLLKSYRGIHPIRVSAIKRKSNKNKSRVCFRSRKSSLTPTHTDTHTKCAWKKKQQRKALKKKTNWKNRIDEKASLFLSAFFRLPSFLSFVLSCVSEGEMQKDVESTKIERTVKILYIEMKWNHLLNKSAYIDT